MNKSLTSFALVLCAVVFWSNFIILRRSKEADRIYEKPRPAEPDIDTKAPLADFPSFGPHPHFKVATYYKRSMVSHFERENLTYYLMKTILNEDSETSSCMVDVGANHAFFSLYAATMGRNVVAVEPQRNLVSLIRSSVQSNNLQNRFTIRNHAIAMEHVKVNMWRTRGDGGTAMAQVNASGEIDALPLSEVLDTVHKVSFMKIDVEGFELVALESAMPKMDIVQNIVVEFGPRRRFQIVTNAVKVLEHLHDRGFTAYLITGWCWKDYAPLGILKMGLSIYGIPVMPLPKESFEEFMNAMKHECMIWWTKTAPQPEPLAENWANGLVN
eukprot:TRINITY_DN2241_c0_g1_i2.p1 TRINITY_DN2241_c0_g1~~TRINITY_DN2241_c0_g1_i2.p1  ORF type:complete len:349 (+),score=68.33 TRINITY_DN2241_c0_g1_i2:66-1049(+)